MGGLPGLMLYCYVFVTCLTRSCISNWATEQGIEIDEACPYKCRLVVPESSVIDTSDNETEEVTANVPAVDDGQGDDEHAKDTSGEGDDELQGLIDEAECEDLL